eukprot:jgi/Botrbrau1/60/Bobra.0022s0054.2
MYTYMYCMWHNSNLAVRIMYMYMYGSWHIANTGLAVLPCTCIRTAGGATQIQELLYCLIHVHVLQLAQPEYRSCCAAWYTCMYRRWHKLDTGLAALPYTCACTRSWHNPKQVFLYCHIHVHVAHVPQPEQRSCCPALYIYMYRMWHNPNSATTRTKVLLYCLVHIHVPHVAQPKQCHDPNKGLAVLACTYTCTACGTTQTVPRPEQRSCCTALYTYMYHRGHKPNSATTHDSALH